VPRLQIPMPREGPPKKDAPQILAEPLRTGFITDESHSDRPATTPITASAPLPAIMADPVNHLVDGPFAPRPHHVRSPASRAFRAASVAVACTVPHDAGTGPSSRITPRPAAAPPPPGPRPARGLAMTTSGPRGG